VIGLVKDLNTKWWECFEEFLKKKEVKYKLIDIEKNDWIDQIKPCDNIIWRPNLTEPFLSQAKEKLIIIEKYLGKGVFPNFDTFWHYDNKNAQKYLAEVLDIPFPNSFVSYDFKSSLDFLKSTTYPLVSKSARGSGSRNVRLLKSYKQAEKEVNRIFNKSVFFRLKKAILNRLQLVTNVFGGQQFYLNIQEFLPENKRDFRITTIGGKFGYAYYRSNRKNDFRASGSGLNNYDNREHDQSLIKEFILLSKRLNFDSMCYDVIYDHNGNHVTVEFSYIYVDTYLHDCPGYYVLENCKLDFVEQNTWPQELILKYLLDKWKVND